MLLELQKKIIAVTETLNKREKKEQDEKKKQLDASKANVNRLLENFEKRDVKLGPRLYDAKYQESNEPTIDPESGVVTWPVLFLYEEHQQTDFIKQFREDETFLEHLSYMFKPNDPIGWDTEGKYKLMDLELYIQAGCVKPFKDIKRTIKKRWIKVKPTTTLEKVVIHHDYVIPQIPVIHVVVANSKFRNEMLKRDLEEE